MVKARSILSLLGALSATHAHAQSPHGPYDLSYAGRLTDGAGAPVAGPVDLQVKLFRSAAGNDQIGVTVAPTAGVPLAQGAFQVSLGLSAADFHTAFDGTSEVWIEVTDATHGKTYPRQRFSAVPYALKVPVDTTSVGYNANGELTVVAVDASKVTGLTAALAAKADATALTSGLAAKADTTALTSGLAAKADTTALTAALATKSDATHTHTLAGEVTGDIGSTIVAKLITKPVDTVAPNTVGQVLKWDGTKWFAGTDATVGGGSITGGQSVGTGTALYKDTVAPDLRFKTVAGTAPVTVSTPGDGDTVTFAIGQASGVQDGYLAQSDFVTFNNKQSAINASSTVTLGEARYAEATGNGANYVALKAPSALGGDVTFTLPATDGTNGYVLKTNGAGQLGWAAQPTVPGTTDALTEGSTNLYFTQTRARGALSATTPLSFNSGTGDFSLGTVGIANGGTGLTAAPANGQLAIGNGTGYTLATVTGGTGINVTNGAGTITIAATADASTKVSKSGDTMSGALNMSSNAVTNLPAPSAGGDAVNKTYADTKQAAITAASVVNGGTFTTALQNGVEHKPWGTNAGETGEARFDELAANGSNYVALKAPDAIGANLTFTLPATDGTNGYVLKTDGAGHLGWAAQPTIPANTDAVNEGSTNLYFTQTRVRNALSATAPVTFNSGTGDFSLSTVGVAKGGTGTTTLATNGILFGNATSAVGVTAAGSQYQVLQAGASGVPAFGALNLGQAAAITGTLPVGNGGTGAATLTSNGIVYGNGTSALGATAAGTQYQVLQAGASGVPTFGALNLSQSAAVSGTLPLARGGTGSDLSATGGAGQYLKQSSAGGAVSVGAIAAADYPTMAGDSGAGGTKGAVPAPATGDAAAGKFLKADGNWTVPPSANWAAPGAIGATTPNSGAFTSLNASGNVGIGTTSPTSQLHISMTDAGAGALIENVSSTTARFPSLTVTNYNDGTAASHPMLNLYNIGGHKSAATATGSGEVLGVLMGGGYTGAANIQGARIGFIAESAFSAGVAPTSIAFITEGTGNPWSASAQRMTIQSNGKVGIGTASPTALLDVAKNQDAQTTIRIGNTDATGTLSQLGLNLNGSGYNSYVIHENSGIPTSSWVRANAMLLKNDGTGIDLAATGASGNVKFWTGGSSNERMRIDTNGFVGIGTTSPGSLLSVRSATGATAEISLNTTTSGNTSRILIGDGGAVRWYVTSDGTGTLDFRNNSNASKVVFDQSGNMGIATAPGTSKLTVAGTIESTTGGVKFPDGTTQTSAVQALSGIPSARRLIVKNVGGTSVTALNATASEISLASSTGAVYHVNNLNVTATMPTDLDTGSEAANTWYYLWVVSDGTTTSAKLSTSSTAPTGSFTYKALVSAVRNDASSNFQLIHQVGRWVYYRDYGNSVLSAGSQTTSFANGTISLAGVVPPNALEVQVFVYCAYTGAANTAGACLYSVDGASAFTVARAAFNTTYGSQGRDDVESRMPLITPQTMYYMNNNPYLDSSINVVGYSIE